MQWFSFTHVFPLHCLLGTIYPCLLAPQVQYTNVALVTVGLLVTWPPAAYALLVLAGAGALLLDQNDASAAATASLASAERRRSAQGRRRSLQEPQWLGRVKGLGSRV